MTTPTRPSGLRALSLAALLGLALPAPGHAEPVYREPPEELIQLIDAPPTPLVSFSPDRRWMLIMERPSLPGIAELSQEELRLAGIRINPRTNGRSRNRWTIHKLTLVNLADRSERTIRKLPPDPRIENVSWAPDSRHIAFTVTNEENIELWVAEVGRESTKRVIRQRLNGTWGPPYRWFPDGRTLAVTIVPEERPPAPEESRVPRGPVIQESTGAKAPARTYQDLLENPHDEALFDHYFTSQVMRVEIDGKRERIGAQDVIRSIEPSPDGRYLLVEILHRPYSYLVRYNRFPTRVEVWDPHGEIVAVLADLPLRENVPASFGSVPTGPRSFEWRSDAPATVCWAEAQDGGDAAAEAEVRDRLFLLPAPFDGDPVVLATLSQRYNRIEWGHGGLAMVSDWEWRTRNLRTWMVEPDRPGTEPVLLFDRSWQDRYHDPGDFVTHANPHGHVVLTTAADGGSLFLIGAGASPEGDRPFLDRLDLETRETTRLWRSEAPHYELPVALLDDTGRRVITRRESPDEPPNYFLRTLGSDDPVPLTAFPHPTPELRGVRKELIRYPRGDGVQLNATLYLPAGWLPADGPLPMVMWAYPTEYKSADDAGQVDDSPYRFNQVPWHSPLVWLVRGYAVLDDPKLPIVGEGEVEPNDTYVEQLVAGAEAAVEEVVRRGVADRDRIAIGGHSYGAFMAANLLAHSDLFRAGIARSGAYNRTLTPFGFQAEERTLWEAPEVYFAMSPFMHADEVDEPILIIHGDADNNSGTFPMQSERFFNALKGHGATARLVMLPYESHGYRARESILHMLWETDRWLETHVKHAEPRGEGARTETAAPEGGG